MHWIDVIITVAFLLATLWIGIASGRTIQSFDEYAVGNRNFSDFAVFCTVAATMIGGSATIGFVGRFYDVGIVHILAPLGLPIAFFLIAIFIVPRMRKFYGCCSIGDIFEKSYGLPGKYTIGLVSFIIMLLASIAQVEAMGLIINKMLNIRYEYSVICSAVFLFVYTGRGGVKAVTFTDVLQFVILTIAIPLMFNFGVQKIGGINKFLQSIPSECWHITPEGFHRYCPLFFIFSLPTLAPMFIQRLLLTKNTIQGVRAFAITATFYLFLMVILIGIGIVVKILYPGLTNADQAVPTLIQHVMPVGIKGIVVAGFLAILMSTADSSLNAASVVLANDLFFPQMKQLTQKTKLRIVRTLTYILGLICVFTALSYNILFEIEVIYNSLWFSTTLFPLYCCLFNKKVSLRGFFVSIVVGFSTMWLWNFYMKPVTHVDGVFPGFFANLICFTIFYFKDGRQKVFPHIHEEGLLSELTRARRKVQLTPVADGVKQNVLLGIFLLVMQIFPILFTEMPSTLTKASLTLVNGAMALLLIFGTQFPTFYKKYFYLLKEITLLLCLPVTSIYLIFFAENGCLHLVSFGLSVLLINLLAEDRVYRVSLFISLTMIAVVTIACLFCEKSLTIPNQIYWFHVLYIFGFIAVLFTVWFKKNALVEERYALARSIAHDVMTPLLVQRIIVHKNTLDMWPKNEQALFQESLNTISNLVDSVMSKNAKSYESLDEENVNELVQTVINQKHFLYKNLRINFDSSQTFKVRLDPFLFQRLISNLINVCVPALSNNAETVLHIRLFLDEDEHVTLQMGDNLLTAALNKHIRQQQVTDKKYNIGLDFYELQKIAETWRAKLSLVKRSPDVSVCQIQFYN